MIDHKSVVLSLFRRQRYKYYCDNWLYYCDNFIDKIKGWSLMVGRNLDLQRIRKEKKITQQRLAEMMKYPQSFISQIENGRVSAPEAFLQKLMELFAIPDLEPYFIPTPEELAVKAANNAVEDRISEQQQTINRLLDMLDRRDERIRELELEVKRLQDRLYDSTEP